MIIRNWLMFDVNRPDICIGTDPYHTPESTALRCAKVFESLGYKVDFNTPFAGAIVPLKFYQQDPRVTSIMIEVNRSLYMDELAGLKTGGFAKLQEAIIKASSAIIP